MSKTILEWLIAAIAYSLLGQAYFHWGEPEQWLTAKMLVHELETGDCRGIPRGLIIAVVAISWPFILITWPWIAAREIGSYIRWRWENRSGKN